MIANNNDKNVDLNITSPTVKENNLTPSVDVKDLEVSVEFSAAKVLMDESNTSPLYNQMI